MAQQEQTHYQKNQLDRTWVGVEKIGPPDGVWVPHCRDEVQPKEDSCNKSYLENHGIRSPIGSVFYGSGFAALLFHPRPYRVGRWMFRIQFNRSAIVWFRLIQPSRGMVYTTQAEIGDRVLGIGRQRLSILVSRQICVS